MVVSAKGKYIYLTVTAQTWRLFLYLFKKFNQQDNDNNCHYCIYVLHRISPPFKEGWKQPPPFPVTVSIIAHQEYCVQYKYIQMGTVFFVHYVY